MKRGARSSDDADGAFDALFRREFAAITRTAYLIVGDREVAREIAQDAFVQVLRHWKKVRVMESPGGWARRVAIRDAVRAKRRDVRGAALAAAGAREPGTTAEPLVLDVRDALLTLPVRQRAAIALHYLDDLPVADIASLLDCTEGTVKTHLSRGRHALAVALGEEANDEPR